MKILSHKYTLMASLCLASFASGAFLNQATPLEKITAPMVIGAQIL